MGQNGYRGRKDGNCFPTSVLDFQMESFMIVYQGKKIYNIVQDTNWSAIKTMNLAKYPLRSVTKELEHGYNYSRRVD